MLSSIQCNLLMINCNSYFFIYCASVSIHLQVKLLPIGTIGAIWANGTFPRKAGEYANMTGCVSDDTRCCSASWNIRVKKCHRNATTFHVYRLTMPPSCYMAYCAGKWS